MVTRTFVSYHEMVLLCLFWLDFLLKFFITTFFNKHIFYVILILIFTNFINPHFRNLALLGIIFYLPSFFTCMFYDQLEGTLALVFGMIPPINTLLLVYFGKYEVLEPSGPYGVGYVDKTIAEDDFFMNVSVFYPMRKTDYESRKHNIRENLRWLTSGPEALAKLGKTFKIPAFLLQELLTYRVECVEGADLHKDFLSKQKKLTPVVVSHGYFHYRTTLSAHINELVSYGCIVFAVDHTDKSCFGYKDYSKDPPEYVHFDNYTDEKRDISQTEFHKRQLEIRMKDIKYLLDFIKKEFSDNPWNLDFKNLVAMGHSMGGVSSVMMAERYPEEFKLCVALDPYYQPIYKEVIESKKYTLKQPLLSLSSETFHQDKPPKGFMSNEFVIDKFDSLKATNKVYEDTKENHKEGDYNLILKGTAHNDMTDRCLYMRAISKRNHLVTEPNKYQVFINIVAAFLNEHKFLPVDFHKKVMEVAKEHI